MFTPSKNRGSVAIFAVILVLVAIVVAGIAYQVGVNSVPKVDDSTQFGVAGPGKSSTNSDVTVERFTEGGRYYATTTGLTATLREQDLLNNGVISVVSGNVASTTLTLPATSTLRNFIPKEGDISRLCIMNDSSAATTTFLAAGTGITIDNASTSLAIVKDSSACMTFIRLRNTDVKAFLNIFL